MSSAMPGNDAEQPVGRAVRRSRRLTIALLLALAPGLVFSAGVGSIALWRIPLWPHQLFFWLLTAAVAGPLIATFVVGRLWWALRFMAMFVAASLLALVVQFGLGHDETDTCPVSQNPHAWEMRMTGFDIIHARATCVYYDPSTGREVDRTSFTVFDRIEYLTGGHQRR